MSMRILAMVALACHIAAGAQALQWARQFASPHGNAIFQIAADSSGVYAVGVTRTGALPGQTAVSTTQDGFLRKYDPSGQELWTREFSFGPSSPIIGSRPFTANGVAVDSTGVYVVGTVGIASTNRPGRRNGVFSLVSVVSKCDANGNVLWTEQSPDGTTLAGEGGSAVALSGGAVYVTGDFQTADCAGVQSGVYLRKFDSAGNQQRNSQFTGLRLIAFGLSADSTGAYIVGSAASSVTGQPVAPTQDLFIRKYDANGNAQWTNQFGTGFSPEYALAVSASSSGVYVIGYTPGLLDGAPLPGDAYVRKYDSNGNLQWTRQFGTLNGDAAFGGLADDSGVYVVGYTKGGLGTARLGGGVLFFERFEPNGNTVVY